MMRSIQEFFHSRDSAGLPKHYSHDIAGFEYCDDYAARVRFPCPEEWKKELCLSAIIKSEPDLETFHDTWAENDDGLLQRAFESPHFTHLAPFDLALHAYRPTRDRIQ